MESAEPSSNPQTEKLVLWSVFFLFCAVLAFTISTYAEENERLEALGVTERQKKAQLDALERQREQTARYIERMGRDPEFVQDQARERLGVAKEGEIVIRIEGAGGAMQPLVFVPNPAPPKTPPATPPKPPVPKDKAGAKDKAAPKAGR
jgi:cell division protein FtsB